MGAGIFMSDSVGSATAKEDKFENVGDKEDKREVDRFTFKCNRDGIIGRSAGPGQSADELIKMHILREDAKKH